MGRGFAVDRLLKRCGERVDCSFIRPRKPGRRHHPGAKLEDDLLPLLSAASRTPHGGQRFCSSVASDNPPAFILSLWQPAQYLLIKACCAAGVWKSAAGVCADAEALRRMRVMPGTMSPLVKFPLTVFPAAKRRKRVGFPVRETGVNYLRGMSAADSAAGLTRFTINISQPPTRVNDVFGLKNYLKALFTKTYVSRFETCFQTFSLIGNRARRTGS